MCCCISLRILGPDDFELQKDQKENPEQWAYRDSFIIFLFSSGCSSLAHSKFYIISWLTECFCWLLHLPVPTSAKWWLLSRVLLNALGKKVEFALVDSKSSFSSSHYFILKCWNIWKKTFSILKLLSWMYCYKQFLFTLNRRFGLV